MTHSHYPTRPQNTYFIIFFLFSFSVIQAQIVQVEILGGAIVTQGSTVTINAGNSLTFRITNVETVSCNKFRVQDVDIANTTDFDIIPNNPKQNIRSTACNGNNNKYLDFEIENISTSCFTTSTLVTVRIKNQADFTFTLEVNSSPEIYVLGGSPSADILHGATTTTDANGTYFGIVDEGTSVTRQYIIANIGNCDLDISAISSSNSDFAISSPYTIPFTGLPPYYYIVFDVTFTAPTAGSGTQSAVISIGNNDNTTFTFTTSAEIFNYSIPGPGGVTADFRLWLKTTRGIVDSGGKVSEWKDYGTNDKSAVQPTSANQPTFLDTATDNINFNPVIKFENDGGSLEQYLYNTSSGFYSQDIFIVVVPDATMTNASSRNTIFAGISSGSAGDMTGIGFGDYSSEFTNETLSYNQDIPEGGSYNGTAEISSSYASAGIINVRNNAAVSPTGQDILYNSNALTTLVVNDIAFANVGSAGPPVSGTQYWIGRNFDTQGSLNGRVAEIFTFAERVSDSDRQKIESYLALKYGITLGASTEAQKDYVNSFDTEVWDITANSGYNYHVAGIGKDSISDLNQKQSKTLNVANEITIGLAGIYDTNSANTNEFEEDGDFLVWGCNNASFTGTSTNTVTLASGLVTSLTRIDRIWKIVETNEDVSGDIETVFISIPSAAFSGFSKLATEEYAIIVADNPNFANGDIIDVIPLRSDGGTNLQTWYNFDGTKYFTFGKVANLSNNHAISIASGDYLVGEYSLNLNVDFFSISAWVKCSANASNRTIMAKGEKLQLRLNSSGNVETYIDDTITPKFTSGMDVDDGLWHHIAFIYQSGTIFLYIDGVLDHSEQNIVHPSPNFNNYAIGAVYIEEGNVINPLLGEIDEVYIWDVALSQDQVRYLMNQEVERFDIGGTDYVNGKILPQAASSNEVVSIPWSNLRVYYDFNSFYGSTVEGLTDERFFLRLKYLDKDKTLIEDQTTPLPYVSAANGAWDTPATWSNNADQIIPNTLSLDGTTMIDWNIVDISHDITSGDRDITLLGLKSNSGTLTIADPGEAQNETNSGQGVTITHYLELDGVIDLVGESQLVQTDGSIVDADSGGYIEKDQQGTANAFNYNYWSSSVGPISGNVSTRGTGTSSTNASHTIAGVLNDGTTSSAYQSLIFDPSHAAADSDTPTFPRTISSYWLYKFYGTENDYDAWTGIDETSTLSPGEGFTMKGTSGTTSVSTDQNYVYKGLPNNGDIMLALDKSSEEVNRLIGNPYPSAIDATEFILDNLSIADGGNNASGTIFNGALYFWDHFGETNSHYVGEYVGGYATRNLTGGAVAISNDVRVDNNNASGSKVPGQYIGVNQGFFVSTELDGFNNDNGTPILTVDGGDIVFKNSQRAFVTEGGSSSLFFKSPTKSAEKIKSEATHRDNTPIIHLMYDSPTGYHRQITLGANRNASLNFDLGYDAVMIDVSKEDMYWMLNDTRLVIQGVHAFEANQEFDLGLVVDQAGIITIRPDAVFNMATDTLLYIRDVSDGNTYSITDNAFKTYLEPGVYNDRFKLVFKPEALTVVDDTLNFDHLISYYDEETSEIKIINNPEAFINSINIYNVLGQQLYHVNSKTNRNYITVPVQKNEGILILQLHTDQGIINKKLILK